ARARGFPSMEPPVAGTRGTRGKPDGIPVAAGAAVRLDHRQRARAFAESARSGHFRGKSSEPHGYAGDPRGASPEMAVARGYRDGQGIFQGAFFSGSIHAQVV